MGRLTVKDTDGQDVILEGSQFDNPGIYRLLKGSTLYVSEEPMRITMLRQGGAVVSMRVALRLSAGRAQAVLKGGVN